MARATGRGVHLPVAPHAIVEESLIVRYHVYEDSFTVAPALPDDRH
jgi:hypothetical protein